MDLNYAKFLIEKIKRDYDLIALDFAKKREKIWEEFLFFFDFLKEGEKILDLGCGNGRWYKIFKEKKVEYIGIDNCQKLIEIARQNFPEGKFLIGDALNLPFPENYFDKVFAFALFHQIPSKNFRLLALKEVKRVLKPKGLFFLTVWRPSTLREFFFILKYTIFKIFGKSKLDFGDFFLPWGKITLRYYHWFSKRELKSLLKEADFKILKIGLAKKKKRRNLYLIAEKI